MTSEELTLKFIDVDGRCRNNSDRLKEVEKRQDDLGKLVTSVALLASKQENIESDVGEIKSDVKSIMEKPAKQWDSLIEKIVYVLIAALIGFGLARLGVD